MEDWGSKKVNTGLEQASLQEKVRDFLNPITIFLVIIELSFLLIAGSVFVGLLNDAEVYPEVVVENARREIDEIPRGVWGTVNATLYEVVSLNSSDKQNIYTSGAIIREGSLTKKHMDDSGSMAGFDTVSFIVDLPEMRQSYWVHYAQSDEYDEANPENEWTIIPAVACPLDDEKTYEEFECRVRPEDRLARNQVVADYLRYFSSDDFYAYIDRNDLDMRQVRIIAYRHDFSQDEKQKYLDEVKSFIRSVGVSPEIFEYIVEPAPLQELNESIDDY